MKINFKKTKTIYVAGWTLWLIPTLVIGWENYRYLKVIQIDFCFLVWSGLLEIKIK